jgi:hypothetical protein
MAKVKRRKKILPKGGDNPDSNRFVFWRRSPDDLINNSYRSILPVIGTLSSKIEEACDIVDEGEYKTVMVLEIRYIITRTKSPAKVEQFKGRN